MEREKFISAVENLTLGDLRQLEKKIARAIRNREADALLLEEKQARELRTESRFKTQIHASLCRLSGVEPGQRTEYGAVIRDVSRKGMSIRITSGFIPTRVVEVTFRGQKLKPTTCRLEVMRMKRIVEEGRNWIELGCRTIAEEEARHILANERQSQVLQARTFQKQDVHVFLIAKEPATSDPLVPQIKNERYQVAQVSDMSDTFHNASCEAVDLAIFLEADDLARDPAQLAALNQAPENMAMLAVVDQGPERFELLKAGVDECVGTQQLETLLSRAMERAIMARQTRHMQINIPQQPRVLVLLEKDTYAATLMHILEENGLLPTVLTSYDEAVHDQTRPFQLVVATFDRSRQDAFTELSQQFETIPVIALCDNIAMGSQAMMCGARDYLSMPVKRKDVDPILRSQLPALFVQEELATK